MIMYLSPTLLFHVLFIKLTEEKEIVVMDGMMIRR